MAMDTLRVLYVEDDDDSREITVALLEQVGHIVTATSLARDAIARCDDGWDVVLVDLTLPDADGWTVARAVKDRNPATPVALLTGWGTQVSGPEARSRGVDEVISKPIGARDLSERLIALTTKRAHP